MASVNFPIQYGGDGKTYTDDDHPLTGLAGGGHVERLIPCFKNALAMAVSAALSAQQAQQAAGAPIAATQLSGLGPDQFAAGFGIYQTVASLPTTRQKSDLLLCDGKVYRWNGVAYSAAVAPADVGIPAYLADGSAMPLPTGVKATPGAGCIYVSWDVPIAANYSHAEVWRAIGSSAFASASKLDHAGAGLLTDSFEGVVTAWYWVRFVSRSGVVGPFHGGSGVSACSKSLASGIQPGELSDSQIAGLAAAKILGPLSDAQVPGVGETKTAIGVVENKVKGTWQLILSGTAPDGRKKLSALQAFNTGEQSGFVITADQLLVQAAGLALNDDPGCLDATAWVTFSGAAASFATISDGAAGVGVMRSGVSMSWMNGRRRIPVDPGKVYRFCVRARRSADANGTFYGGVALFDANGANIAGNGSQWFYAASGVVPGTAWAEYSGLCGAGTAMPIPSSARTLSPVIILNYSGSAGWMEVQEVRIEEVLPGVLIRDGAITAAKIKAGEVKAEHVDTADLLTNSAIIGQLTSNTTFIDSLTANNGYIAKLTSSEGFIDSLTVRQIKDRAGNVLLSESQPLRPGNADPSLINANQRYGLLPDRPADSDIRNNLIDLAWWRKDANSPWPTNSEYNRLAPSTDTGVPDPKIGSDVLWYCKEKANDGGPGGGWDSRGTLALDPTRTYRFVVPIRRISGGGTSYWGTDNVCDLNTTTANGNPYFAYGVLQPGRWYLLVGYIFPAGSTGNTHVGAGIYDCETGQLADGNTFNWCFHPGNGRVGHRAYQYYTSAGAEQVFGRPMVNLVDGTEPSLREYFANAAVLNSSMSLSNSGQLLGGGGGQVTLPGMGAHGFRVVSAGGSATGLPASVGMYKNGTHVSGGGRSYVLLRIRRSDGYLSFSQTYDVYGNGANDGRGNQHLANDLNASPSDHLVVVYTYDEPLAYRLDGGLAAAMYRCGASRAVFGSPRFTYRSAYILVGIPGCGEGNGAEAYQGAVDSDPNAWCELSFQLVNGVLAGVSGSYTPRTLTDYGYVGALDADKTNYDDGRVRNSGISLGIDGQLLGAGGGRVTRLDIEDTRSVNAPPNGYQRGMTREFKTQSVIGLPAGFGVHCTLETVKPWMDSSGGHITQFAYCESGATFKRYAGCSDSFWGAPWVRDLDRNSYTGALDADKTNYEDGRVANSQLLPAINNAATTAQWGGVGGRPVDLAGLDGGRAGKIDGIEYGATRGGRLLRDVYDESGALLSDRQVKNNLSEGAFISIANPSGGALDFSAGYVNGALWIVLPSGWGNTMLRFTLEIYEYGSGSVQTYDIGGYIFQSQTWHNCHVNYHGQPGSVRGVVFGLDLPSGRPMIALGAFAGGWSYPKARIRNFLAGHGNANVGAWESGWLMWFETGRAYTQHVLIAKPSPGGVLSGLDRLTHSRFFSSAAVTQNHAARITPASLSSTSSSISISAWTMRTDAGDISYNAGTLSGLAASTNYYVFTYDDNLLGGAVTYYVTTTYADVVGHPGRIHVGTISTSASGGGTYYPPDDKDCVAVASFIADGRQALDLKVGDFVTVLRDDGQGVEPYPVRGLRFVTVGGVRIRTRSAALECSTTTPLTLEDGRVILVREGLGEKVPVLIDGVFSWEVVEAIEELGPIPVAHVFCDGRTYAAGEAPGRLILTHNLQMKR